MKTINEMVKVMQHYANGGLIEFTDSGERYWMSIKEPVWDWVCFDYRIKEEKKTVTIEKWLCKNKLHVYYIVQSSDINCLYHSEKVKLLETYKVEL